MFSKSSLNWIVLSATSVVGIGVGGRVIAKKMLSQQDLVSAQTCQETIVTTTQGTDYSDTIMGFLKNAANIASGTEKISQLTSKMSVEQALVFSESIVKIDGVVDNSFISEIAKVKPEDLTLLTQSLEKCNKRAREGKVKETAERCLITVQTDQIIKQGTNKAKEKIGDLLSWFGGVSGLTSMSLQQKTNI